MHLCNWSIFVVVSAALVGNTQVARGLARLLCNKNGLNLLGKSLVSKSEVDRWITFASVDLKNDYNSALKFLDSALKQRTFLVDNAISLADIAVWSALRSKFALINCYY